MWRFHPKSFLLSHAYSYIHSAPIYHIHWWSVWFSHLDFYTLYIYYFPMFYLYWPLCSWFFIWSYFGTLLRTTWFLSSFFYVIISLLIYPVLSSLRMVQSTSYIHTYIHSYVIFVEENTKIFIHLSFCNYVLYPIFFLFIWGILWWLFQSSST